MKKKVQGRMAELPQVLAALGDPVRLTIVRHLAEEGSTSCGRFGILMPKSSLSHHFKVLREAGIVLTHREGQNQMNQLNRAAMEKSYKGLLKSVLGRG